MIKRDSYIAFLKRWKDKKVIKVVSGVRRCGKSTLFNLFIQQLIDSGVKQSQIIFINFEDIKNEKYLDYKKLHEHITKLCKADTKYYIFLDEIQHVDKFEKVVDSLYIKDNIDLYITGSNSYFMSSELSTLLTGRYVELKMLPLSFFEYKTCFDGKTNENLFLDYIKNGSFPYSINLSTNIEFKEYMEGILNTLLLNDVVSRRNISNVPFLHNVVEYLADNVGNITSIKSICDTMKSNGLSTNNVTLANYIEGLEESLLIYKVNRFDVSGKTRLVQSSKYYLCDVAIRYFLLGHINDFGRIIENIVFLELKRRYSEIYVGKIGTKEIDFVVKNKDNQFEYFQVCAKFDSQVTIDREIKSLELINNNNPKTIIVYNWHNDNIRGIKVIDLFDWLLNK